VGQEAMIAHTDSNTACDPPQEHRQSKSLPGEEERCRDCANMKCHDEEGRHPNDWLCKRSVALNTPLHVDYFL
jgi:hypothetical protein